MAEFAEEMDPEVQEAIKAVTAGHSLTKVRSIRKLIRRAFHLDKDENVIKYSGSRKFCAKGDCTVDISDISEIRAGWNTDIFNAFKSHHKRARVSEEQCFSLIFGLRHDSLNLIAESETIRNQWVRALRYLVHQQKHEERKKQYDKWIKDHFKKADINKDGCLTFDECLLALKRINICLNQLHAKHIFQLADFKKTKNHNEEDALDPEEFVHLYKILINRPELDEIIAEYSEGGAPVWGPKQLCKFMKEIQKENYTEIECSSMITVYEPSEDNKKEKVLTADGLRALLLAKEHNVFDHQHRVIYQDMKQPICHYYIASSHNTYLVDDQLTGPSSVEGYIQALATGCRCVELDCWDGPEDEPIVYHGYTLTSRIFFKDVIKAINDYAFRASQYPLILSLENHCSPEQQNKMAKYMLEIMGDKIYRNPVEEHEVQLPSPESLRGRILIKDKIQTDSTTSIWYTNGVIAKKMLADIFSSPGSDNSEDEEDNGRTPEIREIIEKKRNTTALTSQLSDLVVYCRSVHFHSFQYSKDHDNFYDMSSFSETKALELIEIEGSAFVDHNKRQLSRIYPKGSRAQSSNYDPVEFWNVGCQIVALNYQTRDEPMQIYLGKFQQNGNCGYVLKPYFLRKADLTFNPNAQLDPSFQKILKIKVISGQQLPKPNLEQDGEVIDPYVVLEIYGHLQDRRKHRTNYIDNNGFNPWWDESFNFTIKMPEIALLRFEVKDNSRTGRNELIGQFTMPFNSIKEGFRHVELLHPTGEPLVTATLFVHINIT